MKDNRIISVVVSVYNEELSLEDFYKVTVKVLEGCSWDYELIFVNDGSQDKSLQILKGFADINTRVKVINFSRNFGHEAAMIAGIDYSSGDGIVCMDADLQHPPEMIPDIIQQLENGYQVISMIRTENTDAGILKNITSKMFYKTLNVLSPIQFESNSSDFFAISKEVAEVLKTNYRERTRYLRGYVQCVGFERTTLEFKAGKRNAGTSKYSIRKLMKFSVNVLCSFSDLPLKLGVYSGSMAAILGILLMIYSIVNKLINQVPAGYTTIIVVLCFMFAILLFVIGIIGQYIAIMFDEVKNRPIYIVKDVIEKEEK